MTIQSKALFLTYDRVRNLVVENSNMKKDFLSVQDMFEDKKNKPDASIMVYGVYNAGKSTLINALVGEEVAATDDVPLTDKITAYPCRNYIILDTPGIDAPKEHENVTKEQLVKADAIIFVVNPLGVVEEAKTLAVLMDLFQARKKVFLVFNEKNSLSEEDFAKLKDQTRERLQGLADERNLQGVLKDIPIVKINAKMALTGKLKNKEKLVELSGCVEFEKKLDQFIMSISQEDIYMRLKSNLLDFLNQSATKIESQSNSELVKQYDMVIANLSKDKLDIKNDMAKRIERNKNELYSNIKSWLYNEVIDIENNINHWVEGKSKLIENDLNSALEMSKSKIKDDIEQLQAKIPAIALNDDLPKDINIEVDNLDQETHIPKSPSSDQGINISKEQLSQLAVSMGKNIKVEHVVTGLNMVKQYLPTLMKGVGQKTIEKWAGNIVGKAVPIAGAALTIGLALHDIFSDDAETEQLKRQQEVERKARERRDQQIEDAAIQISDQFLTTLSIAIHHVIDGFFEQVVDEIEKISLNFEEKDQVNSKLMEKVLTLQQELS